MILDHFHGQVHDLPRDKHSLIIFTFLPCQHIYFKYNNLTIWQKQSDSKREGNMIREYIFDLDQALITRRAFDEPNSSSKN